ncbi:amidohydrolase [Microlunatus ginsengisoli]|uniref:Amidohydrolase n=1 Tax=Microlunatus ginsengisoli TaxID=363863 RepID=A0ABP7AI82_9ACTN
MQTTAFVNGAVFTASSTQRWATSLVIRDDRIVAVGNDAEVRPFLHSADEVVDLRGRLVTPGFVDAHVHPIVGGLERTRCDLSGTDSVEDYRRLIAAYAAGSRAPWILGGGWSMAAFEAGCPDRRILDELVPDRPAYLPNRDHHSAWVNTAALRLAGIDAATPDPADGRIERDAAGHPTGLLHEGAMALVERRRPADSEADRRAALREGMRYLQSLGITGWQDAMVHHDGADATHATYLSAQAEGWLTARVAGALWWDRDVDDVQTEVKRLLAARDEADAAAASSTRPRYSLPHVKVMQDGVIETFTAALIEPYHDRCGHPGQNRGISFLEPELLREVVVELDAAGFGVHFHALGDRAVRDVLDAVEAARSLNGTADRRHQAAHLQLVHPDDVPRFRRLGVAANLQALWSAHEPQMDELTIPFLGDERADRQYPFGDLYRDGATLVMGSDWPVSTPDPWAAIHTAVNRVGPDAPPGTPPLGADQRLTLATALTAYTAGSAWVTRADDLAGTLAAGRAADLAVHDRNPFDSAVTEIAATQVQRTYVGGELVHESA